MSGAYSLPLMFSALLGQTQGHQATDKRQNLQMVSVL